MTGENIKNFCDGLSYLRNINANNFGHFAIDARITASMPLCQQSQVKLDLPYKKEKSKPFRLGRYLLKDAFMKS